MDYSKIYIVCAVLCIFMLNRVPFCCASVGPLYTAGLVDGNVSEWLLVCHYDSRYSYGRPPISVYFNENITNGVIVDCSYHNYVRSTTNENYYTGFLSPRYNYSDLQTISRRFVEVAIPLVTTSYIQHIGESWYTPTVTSTITAPSLIYELFKWPSNATTTTSGGRPLNRTYTILSLGTLMESNETRHFTGTGTSDDDDDQTEQFQMLHFVRKHDMDAFDASHLQSVSLEMSEFYAVVGVDANRNNSVALITDVLRRPNTQIEHSSIIVHGTVGTEVDEFCVIASELNYSRCYLVDSQICYDLSEIPDVNIINGTKKQISCSK